MASAALSAHPERTQGVAAATKASFLPQTQAVSKMEEQPTEPAVAAVSAQFLRQGSMVLGLEEV